MSNIQQWPDGPKAAADDLLTRYCAALDDRRLGDWCGLFADVCSYRILSRENVEQKLPAAILELPTRESIRDRVVALEKTAVYNIHRSRHFVSGLTVRPTGDAAVGFAANLAVYQTDQDGHSRLFVVGTIEGAIVGLAAQARLQSVVVTLDTFSVPTLLAVPV